jgi:ADP-heptose:LPS heptosyltransferase
MPFTQHSALSTQDFHPERILIIHSGGIGDLLLALPAMRVFRQAFPRAVLEMMGRPERLALVAHDLRAGLLHSIDQAEMAYFYAEDAPLPPRLGAFFPCFGAVLLFGGAGGNILAKNVKKAGAGRVISIPPFPPEALRVHISDYLVESLKREGIEGENACGPLQLAEETLTGAQGFFAGWGAKEGARILAIHPGSGSPGKNWPPEKFAMVAGWAAERAEILLLSGPAERGAEEIRKAMKTASPFVADTLPLIRLAGVLKCSRAYLGNDSGITHLAASLGVPTVALYGPTDPAVWGPRGVSVRIIHDKKPCPPGSFESQSNGCAPWRIAIDPDEVTEVLAPLLG